MDRSVELLTHEHTVALKMCCVIWVTQEMPNHFEVFVEIPRSTCKQAFDTKFVDGTLFIKSKKTQAGTQTGALVGVKWVATNL